MHTISSIAVAVVLQLCTVLAHQATAPPMSAAPTGAQTKTKSGLIYETVVLG